MSEYVLCEDCHRVLFKEHGPVCPECLAKRPPKKEMAELREEPKRKVEPAENEKQKEHVE